MLHALAWLIDWRVLAVAGVIGAVVVWRLIGTKAALAAGGAVLALVLFRRGQQSGAASEREKQEHADDKAVATRDEVRTRVNGSEIGAVKKRLSRWQKN